MAIETQRVCSLKVETTMKHKSIIRVLVLIVGSTVIVGLTGCGGGDSGSLTSGGSGSGTTGPTQGWTLFNDMKDQAWVTVQPFTYSGVFTEVSNSPGWWLRDGSGNKVLRLPVNGTIAHAGKYDTWDFSITTSGGGYHVTYNGTGTTTDGEYPSATTIANGTATGMVSSPLGSQSVTGTWYGNDYTVWK